jgi:type II secretion system protein C
MLLGGKWEKLRGICRKRKNEIPLLKEPVITKEFSRSYIEQRILAEWKMILDRTEFSPHSVDGRTRGYRLTKIPEGSLLSELGIQPGDIIFELNGQELKDKAFIISLVDQFKNDDRGELTIERNGRQIRYAFVLK